MIYAICFVVSLILRVSNILTYVYYQLVYSLLYSIDVPTRGGNHQDRPSLGRCAQSRVPGLHQTLTLWHASEDNVLYPQNLVDPEEIKHWTT